ncbi:MAG: hypothetical protein E4H08_10575 [Candidatus Atribacteria bacterium]|nr:MAG: hypothetical protein E4H08_10575 [Candidatus Atribacteria bacterium]
MRRTVLPALPVVLPVALLLSLTLLLSSCYLFIGSPPDLVPLPNTVAVLDLPQILNCSATPVRTACEDLYERICGWYFWTESEVQTPSTGWIYTCRDVWHGVDCLYDITIRLTISDPSDDLDPSKSPRIRVFDSDPAPSGLAFGNCYLDIPQTDIVIQSTDVEGSGSIKTVSVRLNDVRARFTDSCRTLSATLRFAIVFEADGEDLSSTNSCEAVVECNRPNRAPPYAYYDLPQLLGPYQERPVSSVEPTAVSPDLHPRNPVVSKLTLFTFGGSHRGIRATRFSETEITRI